MICIATGQIHHQLNLEQMACLAEEVCGSNPLSPQLTGVPRLAAPSDRFLGSPLTPRTNIGSQWGQGLPERWRPTKITPHVYLPNSHGKGSSPSPEAHLVSERAPGGSTTEDSVPSSPSSTASRSCADTEAVNPP